MRALVLITVLALSACSATQVAQGVAGLGGGPNVAAATSIQAGKANLKSIGDAKVVEIKGPTARPENVETFTQNSTQSADEQTVQADRVETVVVNQVPNWLLAAMFALAVTFGAVGWLSPQPKWLRAESA